MESRAPLSCSVELVEHQELKSVIVRSARSLVASIAYGLAGLFGLFFGDATLHAFKHLPVWSWPAVLLASTLLMIVSAVLVPAAIRITRTSERGRQV